MLRGGADMPVADPHGKIVGCLPKHKSEVTLDAHGPPCACLPEAIAETMKLPIKLNDLLRQRAVESERIEYKAGWNPDAVLRTVCAFADDFANLGGG